MTYGDVVLALMIAIVGGYVGGRAAVFAIIRRGKVSGGQERPPG